MSQTGQNLKRLNVVLPADLYGKLKGIAEKEQTTVTALIRSGIKLRLIVHEIDQTPDASLLIRDSDGERQIVPI